MASANWDRVEAAFHEVADLPAGLARNRRLAEICGDDVALRAAVQALLDGDALARQGGEVADPHVGLRLGAYVLTRRIARGGMAAVYEGQRADGTFTQRVAVKIMDLRLSDQTLVAQFGAEREILARLEHPGVTRLLDGGLTALGEPYLVMEYVEGQPLDRYCDERRLPLEARLDCFAQVGDAVAYAHRQLVLHRDLKPSNILVTAEGRVKVVDFGTATLLQPDRQATTSLAPLTPAYASPEQLTGTAVGTASDQYSLGVVLYELLTGVAPFGDRLSLLAAIERALASTTSTAPHTVVTSAAAEARQISLARLRRLLATDLGTIVTKALAPEPAARYASVQHLVDDLARWRAGAPIEGRPPSVAYRASRFVRRHWAATGVAAVLAVALAAATLVSVERARVAEIESTKARQLSRFLSEMLSSTSPSAVATQAGELTVRQVLDKASPLVSQSLAASPEAEAEVLLVIGTSYTGLNATKEGEAYLRRASERFKALGDEVGLARTGVSLGTVLWSQGRLPEAEAILRTTRDIIQAQPASFDARTRLASANRLASVRNLQRPGDEEGLALLREVLADPEAETTVSFEGRAAAHNLGLQLVLIGRLDEAERWLRDARRRWQQSGADGADGYSVSRSLSELMRTAGRYPEAVTYARDAVDGFTRTLPPGHQYRVASLTTLGRALVFNGNVDEAERVLTESLELFLKIRPRGHIELTGTQMGLGRVYREQRRLAESERILREAQAAVVSAAPTQRGGVLGELGLTLQAVGKLDEAKALLRESHDIFVSYLPADHPFIALAKARIDGATR